MWSANFCREPEVWPDVMGAIWYRRLLELGRDDDRCAEVSSTAWIIWIPSRQPGNSEAQGSPCAAVALCLCPSLSASSNWTLASASWCVHEKDHCNLGGWFRTLIHMPNFSVFDIKINYVSKYQMCGFLSFIILQVRLLEALIFRRETVWSSIITEKCTGVWLTHKFSV